MKKMKMTMVKLLLTAFTGIAAISCSSDEFFGFEEDYYNVTSLSDKDINKQDFNKEEICSSEEFMDYILAKINFTRYFVELDNLNKVYIDSINMYRVDFSDQVSKINDSYKRLTFRFPYFADLSEKEINAMTLQILNKIDNQYKTFHGKRCLEKNRIRTKGNNPETIAHSFFPQGITVGHYTYAPFIQYYDAYNACVNYSHTYAVESGGFTFEDWSSLFIADDRATLHSMNLPSLQFGANEPLFGFHYHAYSDQLSQADSVAAQAFNFPIYIIYDGYFLTSH